MPRRVFYSFHYKRDSWRASMVRKMGALEGNPLAVDNDWEQIKRGGDVAIRNWIQQQLDGRTCTVVLVGTDSSLRRWVLYEIIESWNRGMGVVAIHIHGLKDNEEQQSNKGLTPFADIPLNSGKLSDIAKTYDPPFSASESVYAYIRDHLEQWVDEAIAIRKRSDTRISRVWRRSANTISVSADPKTAFSKMAEIANAFDWTISSKDEVNQTLIAKTGWNVFSLSWGEEVSIRIARGSLGCDITVHSKPRGLTDWGKSSENIGKVLSAVEKELGQ